MAVILVAKAVRALAFGAAGVALPVHLARLGLPPGGLGLALSGLLVASAAATFAARRPAERFGARAVLVAFGLCQACGGVVLWQAREVAELTASGPWLAALGAALANVAVGTTESGPFLALEQVVLTRAAPPGQRTRVLSAWNFVGYAAAALGAGVVALGVTPGAVFLMVGGAGLAQAAIYPVLPRVRAPAAREVPELTTARGGSGGVRQLPCGISGRGAALPSEPCFAVSAVRGQGRPPSSGPLVRRLAALFALDALAGGFVLQALVAWYLHTRFGLALDALGRVFLGTQLLTALSLLLAPACARRFGLLPTMVGSHLVSNVALLGVAVAPTAPLAVGLLLGRHLLSQLDVPTRQAWVLAIVPDEEREAAATLTTLARTLGQAGAPALAGWGMSGLAPGAPFALGAVLKIAYDLLLWAGFRHVEPDEARAERQARPVRPWR